MAYRVPFVIACLCGLPHMLLAQLQITSPANRIVYQRDASNQAVVPVAGIFTQTIDRVEARFVPVNGGTATGWVTVQQNPQAGSFSGTVTVNAGWYSLEVRGLFQNNLVGQATLERVGVGEVFLIMGHSNAQGGDDYSPSRAATDDRVSSVDLNKFDFNGYNNNADPNWMSKLDFIQLCRTCSIAPYNLVPWLWSQLGDSLAKKLNMPVLFYSAAYGGTNMEQNYKVIKGIPFTLFGDDPYKAFRIGHPYSNLKNALIRFVPSTGLRAILALHGENDTDNAENDIVTYYETTIAQSRIDADNPTLPWVVAVSSFKKNRFLGGIGAPHPHVRRAQERVIANGVNVYRGPDLDFNPNPAFRNDDELHYTALGQAEMAKRWNNALTAEFFQSAPAQLPVLPPLASARCNDGTRLTLSLPGNYASYSWDGVGNSASITPSPGVYTATVRDAKGRFWFTPAVQVPTNPGPPRPTITAQSRTTFCQESGGVTLVASGNPLDTTYRWNEGQNQRSLRVNRTGEFTVRAYNRIGCFSETSTVLRTTQAPVPESPTLDKVGPFTVQATPRTPSVEYDWQVDNGDTLTKRIELFKTSTTASYRARSYNPLTLNGENLVCRSAWSAPFAVNLSEFGDEQFIAYPVPSADGFVTLDSRLVWNNLNVSVVTGDGKVIFQQTYPTFDGRLRLYLGPLAGKFYIRAQNADVRSTKAALVR